MSSDVAGGVHFRRSVIELDMKKTKAPVGAVPFVKWPGGKRQLLPRILPYVPEHVNTYFEPFVGGGAVFFALANAKRFDRAVLMDANLELVRTYWALQQDVEGVIAQLQVWDKDKDAFLEIRGLNPDDLSHTLCGARTIYLNRLCFNGLYRVNGSGKFNAPFGDTKVDWEATFARLRLSAGQLDHGRVFVKHMDFSQVAHMAQPGDFVYFDPPYIPLTRTAKFTAYTPGGFGGPEHDKLASVFRELKERGVTALLSNSDTDLSRQLYDGMKIETVQARRGINRDGAKRGPVGELLVSTG